MAHYRLTIITKLANVDICLTDSFFHIEVSRLLFAHTSFRLRQGPVEVLKVSVAMCTQYIAGNGTKLTLKRSSRLCMLLHEKAILADIPLHVFASITQLPVFYWECVLVFPESSITTPKRGGCTQIGCFPVDPVPPV